jgi:aspartyl-tRNA(Asn)/glutamyl-tRNA(Gln) amidotransferase subunit B
MSNKTYQLICGMEVHAELKTASKMFCGCKNDPFHAPGPNTHTCPVCLGMPGGIPVANKKAVEWTIKLGLALGCKINLFSHFDRKNYFYPDLAKGYQISQYDQPFCFDGVLETEFGSVRIRRIHLEEDTGKLLHKTVDGEKISLIDFNRCGVPLIEIVTEPDIISAEHAKAYTKELRRILRYLDIADCDMEQGGMRLEANTSLLEVKDEVSIDVTTLKETDLPKYKVELKNINSFRFLEKAITFEIDRQSEILNEGKIPVQETRGWNEAKGQTFSQRTKEDAEDYRYFPDPDLPPLRFEQKYIDDMKAALPELPRVVMERWLKVYEIETKNSEILVESQEDTKLFEDLFQEAQKQNISPKAIVNAIVNKKLTIAEPKQVSQILSAFQQANQTDAVDEGELQNIISEVLAENAEGVKNYKEGKTQVIGFFIGQIQRKLGKKLDAKQLMSLLTESLNKN